MKQFCFIPHHVADHFISHRSFLYLIIIPFISIDLFIYSLAYKCRHKYVDSSKRLITVIYIVTKTIRRVSYKTSSLHVKTNSYSISIQYLLLTTRFRYHHNRIHNPSLYVNRQYTYYLRSMKIGYSTLHFFFYLCHVYIFTVWPKEVMIN